LSIYSADMPGQGPAPKHPDDRARANADPFGPLTKLPPEGYQGPIPDWPATIARDPMEDDLLWGELWRTPHAAAWVRAGAGVYRVIARYVILQRGRLNDKTLAEIRQLEDRLGLNPLAMLRLRWEVAPDEIDGRRQRRARPVRVVPD
jgi:hypothetical protein